MNCERCDKEVFIRFVVTGFWSDQNVTPNKGTKALCGGCAVTFIDKVVEFRDKQLELCAAVDAVNDAKNRVDKLEADLTKGIGDDSF